jgi:hypothetical protein
MYSYIKLEKSASLTIVFGLVLLLSSWSNNPSSYAQSIPPTVKITPPDSNNQQVPIGELTIFGTSSDNSQTDCAVYVDWNDLKPYQKVVATGPGGKDDYSRWIFTYTEDYHTISKGVNELTSKISCHGNPINLTKHNSINVTGVQAEAVVVPPESEMQKEDSDTRSMLPFGSANVAQETQEGEESSQLNPDDNDEAEEQNEEEVNEDSEDDDSFDGDDDPFIDGLFDED